MREVQNKLSNDRDHLRTVKSAALQEQDGSYELKSDLSRKENEKKKVGEHLKRAEGAKSNRILNFGTHMDKIVADVKAKKWNKQKNLGKTEEKE